MGGAKRYHCTALRKFTKELERAGNHIKYSFLRARGKTKYKGSRSLFLGISVRVCRHQEDPC